MNKPKRKTNRNKAPRRKTVGRLLNQIDKLNFKIYGLEQDKEFEKEDQRRRKEETERLMQNVKVAYNTGEELKKVIERLEREKKLVWDSLHKAAEQINPMRELLEFCLKCLDDFKNRHLVVCHECESDKFRFKNISLATDFERLMAKLAPYRQKKSSLDFVRMPKEEPAANSYVLPLDAE